MISIYEEILNGEDIDLFSLEKILDHINEDASMLEKQRTALNNLKQRVEKTIAELEPE